MSLKKRWGKPMTLVKGLLPTQVVDKMIRDIELEPQRLLDEAAALKKQRRLAQKRAWWHKNRRENGRSKKESNIEG